MLHPLRPGVCMRPKKHATSVCSGKQKVSDRKHKLSAFTPGLYRVQPWHENLCQRLLEDSKSDRCWTSQQRKPLIYLYFWAPYNVKSWIRAAEA